MAERTAIAWTDATWNPTVGCSRVSEGCRSCYAERMAWRHVLMCRAQGRVCKYEGTVHLVGDEAACRERLAAFASAGVTMPVVLPFTPAGADARASLLRTLRAFG